MNEMQRYVYRPLYESRREIRLIDILNLEELLLATELCETDPELQKDSERLRAIEDEIIVIRCTISHVSLVDKPVYAALSYTWGNVSDKRRMIIEEGEQKYELSITESLNSALRHIDLGGQVWIDAVCINQADNTEKGWQVQQMWTVYNEAQHVAAWLGPAADDSDLVMTQIVDIQRKLANDMEGFQNAELGQKTLAWRPPADFLSLFAFSALTRRSYWRRAWIQQELKASQSIWFHCGQKKVNIAGLELVILIIKNMHADIRRKNPGPVQRDSFESLLGSLNGDESMSVARAAILLHRSSVLGLNQGLASLLKGAYIFRRGLEASDPRDHIFASLGMSTDASDLGIIPDYSKTKAKVFAETAFTLIMQRGLEVLTWCNSIATSTQDSDMPSWAPDWSTHFLKPLCDLGRKTSFRYQASRDSPARFRFLDSSSSSSSSSSNSSNSSNSNDFPLLCISGIQADHITIVGQAMMYSRVSDIAWLANDQDPNYQLQQLWLSDIEQLSKHCRGKAAYPTAKALEDAIWRTPITDMEITPEGEIIRARSALQEGYRLYKKGAARATISRWEFAWKKDDFNRAAKYWQYLVTRSSGRRYFVSQQGYLGVGPEAIAPGDVVVIVLGLPAPLVLRPVWNDCFRVVGEAYVHGIMDGELADESRVQEFRIC